MAPTPDGGSPTGGPSIDPEGQVSGDSIVITGMSALMPGCCGLDEFEEKLYGMESLVTDEKPRWKSNHPEVSSFHGTVPDVDRFDAQFFMINYRLGQSSDTMSKKLLEQAYQAIIDAGVSPNELSGKRVGVFIATGICEIHKVYAYTHYGSGLLGAGKSMFANRISYWLNAKGPSYTLEVACCGSLMALERAYDAIIHGQCDAAIVGGARLALHPNYPILYSRLIPLNYEGKTKCYDENADGQNLTEGITTLFVQKYKDARRVYAEIYHIKSIYAAGLGDEFKDKFGPYRDPTKLSEFLQEFYEEAQVSPSSVEYVEGCGAALPDADKAELQAMEQVFCQERSKPLLVGSVTSNMGFTEVTSGLCGVIKLLLAYQRGELAANLHYENPRHDIPAIRDGRMKIISKHAQFDRSFTALNNLSVNGLNAHLLLRGLYKNKDVTRYRCAIPYMVLVSGREEPGVQYILDSIKSNNLDPEEIALLHAIHRKSIPKHMARGYGIYETQNETTVALSEKMDYYDDARRPLWFVYSGMGSQWAGMGAQLMRIPIFAAAIERCDKVLKPRGVDIVDIITNPDKSVFDNILNSFVGIAAIQIGLTDILRAVGLVPDKIIGHSVGELGCAYADDCCTAEEMILLAYYRGLVSTQTNFIKGSMYAVGTGYMQLSKICPPEIDVACHNGPDSSTISGPVEAMRKFVAQLTARGIFAKEVNCSNIAYHSRYVAEAGPELLRYCKMNLKEPKLRSERWLSTSVPQDRWHQHSAKYSSAEYFTNNLLNPVLFEETLRLVPSNAVLVEVAPHGLLQAILKRSLSLDCKYVPITKRSHHDCVLFFLEALGTLYMWGYDLDMSALYPKIEFPVSTQTRRLSHLVKWVHTEEWSIYMYQNAERQYMAVYKPIVTIYDEEFQFLEGSIIEGTRVFPLAGALVFVWDTLCMITGRHPRETSVQFHKVKYHRQLVLKDNQALRLMVMLQRGSGQFEVTHEDMLVVEGRIVAAKTNIEVPSTLVTEIMLNSTDIYKLLFERGYQYKNEFRSIHSSNLNVSKAQIIWRNNWITFIDGALQLCALNHDHNGVSQPQYIKRICIDIHTHLFALCNATYNKDDKLLEATMIKDQNTSRCGGLTIENITFEDKPLLRPPVALKTLTFVPFFQDANLDIPTSLYVFCQIVSEYVAKKQLTVLNIDNAIKPSLLGQMQSMLNGFPVERMDVLDVKHDDVTTKFANQNPDIIILNSESCNVHTLESLYYTYPSSFLITIGVNVKDIYVSSLYTRVSAIGRGLSKLELMRWKSKPLSAVALTVGRPEDLQCLVVARTNLQPHQKLVVFTSYPPPSDLKNLVKQWRMESDRNEVYLAMVNDKHKVDMKQLPSFELPFNIFYKNTWGGEYYVPLNISRVNSAAATLRCRQLGDLSSLYWAQIPSGNPQPGHLKVQVHYAELNVYDAQRALAQISIKKTQDHGFGMSFSGITESGEYVMGVAPTGSVSEQIWSHPEHLWPVPVHWDLEDAATVPLAYIIAFYCLGIKSRLVPGTRVLVHGGAGAVGQACISIALASGCQVFTTVSDHNKKLFLTNLFPKLPADHIGNSRDDTFKDMIMNITKGEGCEILLSCVKAPLTHVTLLCCGLRGTTFDLVQIHKQANFEFGMFNLMKSRSYVTVDIASVFSNQNIDELRRIRVMMSEGISNGYVRPLSRVTYAPHDAARAFRLLAASNHRGRVLLHMLTETLQAKPSLSFASHTCHVLLCDKNGFGIHLADRLVQRGIKQLCLNVPDISNYLIIKKQLWEKLGVEVRIVTHDVHTIEDIQEIVYNGISLGPIEGIYVLATDLMDRDTKDNTDLAIFNLDVVSRKLCSGLRYFAVITEDDSIGQTVCLKRKECNLNSLLLQLKLEKFADLGVIKDNNMAMRWCSAVEAIETALISSETFVFANLQTNKRSNAFGEGTQFSGLVLTSATEASIALKAGINEGRKQELCSVLADEYNVKLDHEVPGFGGYFSYIDDDELRANCELVFMPTLTHTTNTEPDEYDDDEAYLCIVPGMEGHHERFRVLCERLKMPAVVLQLGFGKYHESIQEIAQRLVNVLIKKLKIRNEFYLLGYEFGIPIVLEMVTILENYGLTGTVYCLGGTPNDFRAALESKLQDMEEDTLQIALLEHFHSVIIGEKTEFDKSLREISQYSNKVKFCVESLLGRVPYTSQYIEALMEVAYSRIKLLRQCDPDLKVLRAKIIILRAQLPEMSSIEMWNSSHNAIVIHDLEVALDHAPQYLKCAVLINKYLGRDILAKFTKRNLCESHIKRQQLQ